MKLKYRDHSEKKDGKTTDPSRSKKFIASAAAAAICTFSAPGPSSISGLANENVAMAEQGTPDGGREESGPATVPTTGSPAPSIPGESAPATILTSSGANGETETAEGESPGMELQEPRGMSGFDLGVNTFSTESGASSFYAQASLPYWFSLRTGVMWFPADAFDEVNFAPFGTFMFTPEFYSHGVRGGSYTSVSGAMLNSELFAFQSFGLGFERKTGEFALRGAGVFGGAFAYPHFDLMYADLRIGASLEWQGRVLVYGALSFFAAADSAAQTAYIGYYRPRFQSLDIGIEGRINQWNIGVEGTYDVVRSGLTATVERTLTIGQFNNGSVWASLGFAKWADALAGNSWELAVLAGVELSFNGSRMNSTSSSRFEHLHGGGVSQAEMDLDNPLVNRTVIDPLASRVEHDLVGATSMEDFSSRYEASSVDELIMVGRILTHRANLLYSYAAADALSSFRFFDPEVQRIAGMSYDDVLGYLGASLLHLNTYGNLDNLPEYLANGIGMCTMIHDFGAAFLRSRGLHAITTSVNTDSIPHVVMIVMSQDSTILVDYGDEFRARPHSFDEVLRLYGMYRGAMVLRTQMFDDELIGVFTSSEGRVVIHTLGFDNLDILFDRYLGRRAGFSRPY